MDRNQIYQFLRDNPVFSLATVDQDKPAVRCMALYKADEQGILFSTSKKKNLHEQLCRNPQVEMLFYNPDDNLQVRVSGKVMLVEDLDLKKRVVEKFSFLEDWIKEVGYDTMAIWKVLDADAAYWKMEEGVEEQETVRL